MMGANTLREAPIMTQRRQRQEHATTPITPGAGYPDKTFLDDDEGPLAQDVIDKFNAGARLFFALYHHPQAREFFSSSYATPGLMKAYMLASKAWGL